MENHNCRKIGKKKIVERKDSRSTANKYATQLERDIGAQIQMFVYFPNATVGSCGCFSFGEITEVIKTKSREFNNFKQYWSTIFSLVEAKRRMNEAVDLDECFNNATQHKDREIRDLDNLGELEDTENINSNNENGYDSFQK
ncbi:hypothetical protein OUZ56_033932 [Daphnia magna]|uniref:Uncharacterized protein n=1 Tax=Daphnia magna TaxID=35525 RepID=A0ABQ9ZYL2_9CRUS|nr:hypothetical protein OUZ56_033932 [Daphnia magna]